jgi:ABC-type amino acid transport substrate-binding protein
MLNVHVGPWRPMETDPDKLNENNIRVNVGMFGGTFGCRRLLIRTEDRARFARIKHLDELRALKAGAGRGWVDIRVMRENQLTVVDSADISTMLNMLQNRRFDFLPMSMLEVDSLVDEMQLNPAELMVSPNLMLYYPLPMIAYVSPKEPALARRIEQGLSRARADGSLGRLTATHFKDELARFKADAPIVLPLEHLGLPAELAGEPALCQQAVAHKTPRAKGSR